MSSGNGSGLPLLHEVEEFAGKAKTHFGVRLNAWVLALIGLALFILAFLVMPGAVSYALSLALFIAPVWLPFLLVGGALTLWLIWRRGEFIASQSPILLEIKPPRSVVKTPLAMEAFLSTLHQTGGESTWYARWIKGGVRPWFSLEMASIEGRLHFYIWTLRKDFRRIIESQLYAQYPGVQISEVADYTRTINATPEEYVIWGCDFKHTDADPIPIKTYIEYGLDKVQKEPEQVDPIANLIEFMGSVGKGEYLWLQMIFRAHKGEKYNRKNPAGKDFTWKDAGNELVQQIRAQTVGVVKYRDVFTGEMRESEGFPNPTKGQSEKIAAIERNTSKLAFDVGIRSIYLAKKENFNGITIGHMISLFKPFSTEGWNGINSSAWMKTFDDYPWEIGIQKLKNHYIEEMVQAYRRRQFFHEPFSYGIEFKDIMVMSTEELATVYHIPSSAVETPSIDRVQSATGQAPPNLPI